MKNAELIARLRVIAGKRMADYFNSGHPNSNAITDAADAIEKLQAEVERLNAKIDEHTKLCVKRVAEVTRERNIAQAQLAAVQTEVERLKALAGGYANENLRLQAQIASAQTEVERLGMALRGYQVAIETAEESLKDRVALAMEVDRLSAAGVSHCGHRPPCIECSKYAAPIPQQPSVPEGWKQAVALAYGHLWHVNNEPMAPIPLRSSETAAYEARKQLRDLLTHEERGLAINQVQAMLAASPQPKEPK